MACMYRELCNLHARRTACYACIQCALRITRTSRIHHSRSTARITCTARRQLTDIGCACIPRSAYAQVEIFPHLQDPIYAQDPTHHSSHTALPDEHCSGRKHLHLSNAAHSYRYCTQHTQCMHHMRTVGLETQPRRYYRPLRFTQQEINQCELRNEAINRSLDRSIARFD